jgi:hypothetical protein
VTASVDLARPVPSAPRGHTEPFDSRIFFGKAAQRVALLVLACSVVFPVRGLGIDLCAFHRYTALPCPGCGMTRAVAAVGHGQLLHALSLHPLVAVLYPLLVFVAALLLWPLRWRERLLAGLERHRALCARVCRLAVVGFVSFGVARLFVYLFTGQRFP